MRLRDFSFLQNAQAGSETHRTLYSMGNWSVSPEIERPKLDSDSLSLCCVEVKKEWIYLYPLSLCPHGEFRDCFKFTLYRVCYKYIICMSKFVL